GTAGPGEAHADRGVVGGSDLGSGGEPNDRAGGATGSLELVLGLGSFRRRGVTAEEVAGLRIGETDRIGVGAPPPVARGRRWVGDPGCGTGSDRRQLLLHVGARTAR